jgi:outer membrane protein assembly complex protein YaeT
LTASQLDRGLFKIHQLYLRRGKPQATVTVLNRVYNERNNTEKLAVQIDAGPQVRVRTEGAKVAASKLRELLPVYREGNLDETAVNRGGEILRDYFERKGFFSARVKGERRSSQDRQTIEIIYRVELNEQGMFVGYVFQGNHGVSSEELAAALSIHPKDFLRERGTFTHDLLAHDEISLRTLYENRGYSSAKILSAVNDHYEGRRGNYFVTFQINEGPQTTVNQLAIEGISPETVKAMWPSLLSKPGRPYSVSNVYLDREAMINYFADHGQPSATVTWETRPASVPNKVDLKFQVEPGEREKVDRVAILGLEHTRKGVVQRELPFRNGLPLRQSDVLESQRRLYDLGVFSQVQVVTEDSHGSQEGKTVLVSVEEAKRWTVGYGGGIEFQRLGSDQPQGVLKVSPRLSLEVSRLNVGGRAQILTLRGRLSTIDTGGAISYLVPHFPDWRDLSFRITGLADQSREVTTFTSKRREVILSLEKRYSPATILAARYSFRKVEALDVRVGTAEQIPILSRPARVATIGLSYANDHRDEPTDASRGSYSLADIDLASGHLGSQSNFVRVSGQNATYYQINPHLIFARNTRLAIESTYGTVTPTGEIPLPERFFMGGSESHRGFSINQAGPRDLVDGFPLGGEALFFNTVELRARLAGDRLGLVLFQDAGNVFTNVNRMKLLKFKQNSPADLDFNSLAAGIGVRYKTPVGPVRFDVGYNFNTPKYQIIVNSGTPTAFTEVHRLPRFQFFLSIGQSF